MTTSNYEKKYNMLLDSVKQLGDEGLIGIADMIESTEVEEEEKAQPTITKPTITKDEIMAIRDPKERLKAINENSNLFGGNQ